MQASREERYRLIWASDGPAGSGKTHWALTAPAPIAYMLFDPIGLEGLVNKSEFRKKDIRVIEYRFQAGHYQTDEERAAAALETLDAFIEDYEVALKNARSIVWDKEDQVYAILRYARLEACSGRPASYYELNLQYQKWVQQAADAGVNLGLLRGLKEVWGVKANKKTGAEQPYATGEFVARGTREVPELVQLNLAHRYDAEEKQFMVKVLAKCRLNASLVGEEFSDFSFTDMAMALYPESDESSWV